MDSLGFASMNNHFEEVCHMKVFYRLLCLCVIVLAPVLVSQATPVLYTVTGSGYGYQYQGDDFPGPKTDFDVSGMVVFDYVQPDIFNDPYNPDDPLNGHITDVHYPIESFILNFDGEQFYGTEGGLNYGGSAPNIEFVGYSSYGSFMRFETDIPPASSNTDFNAFPYNGKLEEPFIFYNWMNEMTNDLGHVICIDILYFTPVNSPAPVPEPATLLLLGSGLLGLAGFRKKIKK